MKQSKSAKIRKLVMEGATTKEIVRKTHASTQLVYAVRRKMRQQGEVPAPRERGGISEVKPIGMVEMVVASERLMPGVNVEIKKPWYSRLFDMFRG